MSLPVVIACRIVQRRIGSAGDDGSPAYLLILAYQRTGSSFLGELLNQNPDAFYSYEPLDGLYTAMYGTRNGWAVPDDISHHRNGSTRSVARRHQSPQERLDQVSRWTTLVTTGTARPGQSLDDISHHRNGSTRSVAGHQSPQDRFDQVSR